MLIQHGLVHDGTGSTSSRDVRVDEKSGLIAEVGEGLAPRDGEKVVDASGLHVLPGFCQASSIWGVNGSMTEIRPSSQDNDELSDPVCPELSAFYAFNGRAALRQQLARFGLTTAGVAPTDNNLFGGTVAAFELTGTDPYKMVLRRECAMMASVHAEHLKASYGSKGKAPQTRMWIYANLDEWLRKAEAYDPATSEHAEKPDDKLASLHRVTEGELSLWVSCDSALAVSHVRRIAEKYPKLRLVLVNGYGLSADDDWIVERNVPVIVRPGNSPYDKVSLDLDMAAIAALLSKGALVAMGGECVNAFPCREDMLWCAGMLMRELHDSDLVLPTVTSNAAKILGIDDVTGTVEPGKRADLTLWTDDPLATFQARLVSTYQAGEKVYQEGGEHTWF